MKTANCLSPCLSLKTFRPSKPQAHCHRREHPGTQRFTLCYVRENTGGCELFIQNLSNISTAKNKENTRKEKKELILAIEMADLCISNILGGKGTYLIFMKSAFKGQSSKQRTKQ